MRDYSNLLDRTIEWKSNDEIKRFEKSYKNYIIALLRKQNIDDFYCNTLFNDILIKYASGKINYDKTMGKFETFLYRITSNTAQDFLRERKRSQDRETEIDNANTSTFYEITHHDNQTFEYFRLIAVETLNALNRMNRSKERLLEIVEDGQVRPDEYQDFVEIKGVLDKIALSVANLQLWVNEQIAEGNLEKPDQA